MKSEERSHHLADTFAKEALDSGLFENAHLDDDGYCETCGGTGIIITCCDDLCANGDHCIHGDGEDICL